MLLPAPFNCALSHKLRTQTSSCSLIVSGFTPFNFTVLAILKNLPRCSFGSSLGCLVNWYCCTIVIKAGFSSKFFASIGGCLIAEFSYDWPPIFFHISLSLLRSISGYKRNVLVTFSFLCHAFFFRRSHFL